MAKNTNKKAKFKEIKFTLKKADFKKILENQLKHISSFKSEFGIGILNCLKISVSGNLVYFTTSDSHTLLETFLTLDECATGNTEVVLNGAYLQKLKLNRDYCNNKKSFSLFDVLNFTIREEETLIEDERNQIIYKIPHYAGVYVKYAQLFPKAKPESYITIGLNPDLLARFSKLISGRQTQAVLKINKNDKTAALVLESSNNDNLMGYRGLIMPLLIRE